MAITLKPTDSVKTKALHKLTRQHTISGTTGTTKYTESGITKYITPAININLGGPVTSCQGITDSIYDCSLVTSNPNMITVALWSSTPSTAVTGTISVTYETADIYQINKKDGTVAWAKCKPVTVTFDSGIESWGYEVLEGSAADYDGLASGDTVYLPCGSKYSIYASADRGYEVVTEDKIIDLTLQSNNLLTSVDFDPVTYNFESQTQYKVTVPAKNPYITSANVSYISDGGAYLLPLSSTSQTIYVDRRSHISYANIIPASGYLVAGHAAYEIVSSDGFSLTALKVYPKSPVVTWTVEDYTGTSSIYKKQYTVAATNPNPLAATYYISASTSSHPTPSDPTPYDDSMAMTANSSSKNLITNRLLSTVPGTLYCMILVEINSFYFEQKIFTFSTPTDSGSTT